MCISPRLSCMKIRCLSLVLNCLLDKKPFKSIILCFVLGFFQYVTFHLTNLCALYLWKMQWQHKHFHHQSRIIKVSLFVTRGLIINRHHQQWLYKLGNSFHKSLLSSVVCGVQTHELQSHGTDQRFHIVYLRHNGWINALWERWQYNVTFSCGFSEKCYTWVNAMNVFDMSESKACWCDSSRCQNHTSLRVSLLLTLN